MDLKKLVEEASKISDGELKNHPEKDVHSVRINFEDEQHETVNIYEDEFEDNESNKNKIVVCEAAVGKYDPTEIEIADLMEYNRDLFFSRVYISEDKKIIIESCSFFDNLNSNQLSSIIDEIAETSNDIRNTLL